jgi:hypothetical protein
LGCPLPRISTTRLPCNRVQWRRCRRMLMLSEPGCSRWWDCGRARHCRCVCAWSGRNAKSREAWFARECHACGVVTMMYYFFIRTAIAAVRT